MTWTLGGGQAGDSAPIDFSRRIRWEPWSIRALGSSKENHVDSHAIVAANKPPARLGTKGGEAVLYKTTLVSETREREYVWPCKAASFAVVDSDNWR